MALDSASLRMLQDGAAALDIELSPTQSRQFATYAALLQLWGKKINLTTRISAKEIVVYHFLDSLSGLAVIGREDVRVADLGAGAGFPGLPLRIASPGIRLSLVDSSHKKISFCREVAARTGLDDVGLYAARAEEAFRIEKLRDAFDWVVIRAFRDAAEALRLALPFLAVHGSLLLYKGSPDREELAGLEAEAAKHGLSVSSTAAQVPFLNAARTLLVVSRSVPS